MYKADGANCAVGFYFDLDGSVATGVKRFLIFRGFIDAGQTTFGTACNNDVVCDTADKFL